MARFYTIQKRDTLGKIAKKFYGDSSLYNKLANYNGILNPNLIRVGQAIEVPSRRELEGRERALPELEMKPPNGLDEILADFGNIYDYIREDGTLKPQWEREHFARASLPYSIPLSWDQSKKVSRIYCHKKLIKVFPKIFSAIEENGLRDGIRTFGGCFNFRSKRSSGRLSTHSWGIAIDLNPDTNAQGTPGDMQPEIVDIFRQYGFKWGGDWTGRSKDPMHFQFCTGY